MCFVKHKLRIANFCFSCWNVEGEGCFLWSTISVLNTHSSDTPWIPIDEKAHWEFWKCSMMLESVTQLCNTVYTFEGSFSLCVFFWLRMWFLLAQHMGCTWLNGSVHTMRLSHPHKHQPITSNNKSQWQIAQCEWALRLLYPLHWMK